MKINIHIYQSGILQESRIRRHCSVLKSHNIYDQIRYYGYSSKESERLVIDNGLQVNLLHKHDTQNKNLLFKIISTWRWGNQVVREISKIKPNVITCHSLPVLSYCVKLKKIAGCKLVYEPHELETESNVCKGIRKRLAKLHEKILIVNCDRVITVCGSISDWYKKTYNLKNVYTVRNIPEFKAEVISESSNYFKKLYKLQSNQKLFIYQGTLGNGRRIDQYLNIFKNFNKHHNVVFMGLGEYRDIIKKYSKMYSNIFYHDPVPSDQVLKLTSSADVGLCGVENTCLSYYLSLPNKIFEYMAAQIPYVVPNYPEMSKIVHTTKTGWLHEDNIQDIKDLILKIDNDAIFNSKKNLRTAVKQFNWSNEKVRLLSAYQDI